jgi:hypothetical protein
MREETLYDGCGGIDPIDDPTRPQSLHPGRALLKPDEMTVFMEDARIALGWSTEEAELHLNTAFEYSDLLSARSNLAHLLRAFADANVSEYLADLCGAQPGSRIDYAVLGRVLAKIVQDEMES